MTHTIDSHVDPRIIVALPKCTKSQLTALLEIRRRGTVGVRTLGVSDLKKPTVSSLVARGLVTEDTTCGGNEGHYVNSWEWTVDEDPSREDVKRIVAACGVKLAALHSGYLRERKTPCKRAASLSRTVT